MTSRDDVSTDSCNEVLRQTLLGLTYQDLITTPKGREVVQNLVNAVINQQIGLSQSVAQPPFVFSSELESRLFGSDENAD